jgi:hypothetical protein
MDECDLRIFLYMGLRSIHLTHFSIPKKMGIEWVSDGMKEISIQRIFNAMSFQ